MQIESVPVLSCHCNTYSYLTNYCSFPQVQRLEIGLELARLVNHGCKVFVFLINLISRPGLNPVPLWLCRCLLKVGPYCTLTLSPALQHTSRSASLSHLVLRGLWCSWSRPSSITPWGSSTPRITPCSTHPSSWGKRSCRKSPSSANLTKSFTRYWGFHPTLTCWFAKFDFLVIMDVNSLHNNILQ